tara:strand:+ start:673 stop:858 length:186 start_codon:yes stop_codon:yes gene_type:complete
VWRSLEARFLGMEEAPSSNLGTSTINRVLFAREGISKIAKVSNRGIFPFFYSNRQKLAFLR